MRWLRRGLQTIIALGLAYVAAVGAAPLLGIRVPGSDRLFEAQVVSFQIAPLAGFAAVLVLTGLIALGLLAFRRRPGKASVVVTVLCLLGALAWSGFVPVAQARPSVAAGARQLRIASWNTEANLSAAGLANLLARTDPDVVVLPETQASDLKEALAGSQLTAARAAYNTWVSPSLGFVAPVAVMIKKSLGGYRVTAENTTTYGSLTLEPDTPGMPVIVGLHAASPIPKNMEQWRADLGRISALAGCTQTASQPVIVAGDFNAALTHGSLAVRTHCTDTQSAVGNTWDHTWPTYKPEWMGTTIDHVFLGGGMAPVSCQVATIQDSDHRAVLATVALPA